MLPLQEMRLFQNNVSLTTLILPCLVDVDVADLRKRTLCGRGCCNVKKEAKAARCPCARPNHTHVFLTTHKFSPQKVLPLLKFLEVLPPFVCVVSVRSEDVHRMNPEDRQKAPSIFIDECTTEHK